MHTLKTKVKKKKKKFRKLVCKGNAQKINRSKRKVK